MKPESDPQLEADIHRKLRALPEVPAPPSLAPRVMAALQAQASAWWRQTWWHWPLAAKVAFLSLALALAGLAGGGGMVLEQNVTPYAQQLADGLTRFSGYGANLVLLTREIGNYASTVNSSVWLGLLAVAVGSYLICVGIGSAFVRLTLNRHHLNS